VVEDEENQNVKNQNVENQNVEKQNVENQNVEKPDVQKEDALDTVLDIDKYYYFIIIFNIYIMDGTGLEGVKDIENESERKESVRRIALAELKVEDKMKMMGSEGWSKATFAVKRGGRRTRRKRKKRRMKTRRKRKRNKGGMKNQPVAMGEHKMVVSNEKDVTDEYLKQLDGEQRSDGITKRDIHILVKGKMDIEFKKDIIKKIHKAPEEKWRQIIIRELIKKITPELPNRQNTFEDLMSPTIQNWISDSPEIVIFMKFLQNVEVKESLDQEWSKDLMKEINILFKIHDLNKAHPEKLKEAKKIGSLGGKRTRKKRKKNRKKTQRLGGRKKRKTRRRKKQIGCRKN